VLDLVGLGQVPHPPTGAGLSPGMLQHGPPKHESCWYTCTERKQSFMNTFEGILKYLFGSDSKWSTLKQCEEKFWEESGSPFSLENPREVTPEKPPRNYSVISWLNCHQYGKVSYP